MKDVSDVVAYVIATSYAVGRMETLPLCTRLLKETHEVQLEGHAARRRTPGRQEPRKTG